MLGESKNRLLPRSKKTVEVVHFSTLDLDEDFSRIKRGDLLLSFLRLDLSPD